MGDLRRGTDEALGHVGFLGAAVDPESPDAVRLPPCGETRGSAASPPRRRRAVRGPRVPRPRRPPRVSSWIYDGNVRSQRVASGSAPSTGAPSGLQPGAASGSPRPCVRDREAGWRCAEVVRITPVLSVPDVAAAVAWWRDELGFGVEWLRRGPAGRAPRSCRQASRRDAASVRLRLGAPSTSQLAVRRPGALRRAGRAASRGRIPVDEPWGMREVAVTDPGARPSCSRRPGQAPDEVHLRGGHDRPDLLPAARPGGGGSRLRRVPRARQHLLPGRVRGDLPLHRRTAIGASSRTSRSSNRSRSSLRWAPSPSASGSSSRC